MGRLLFEKSDEDIYLMDPSFNWYPTASDGSFYPEYYGEFDID